MLYVWHSQDGSGCAKASVNGVCFTKLLLVSSMAGCFTCSTQSTCQFPEYRLCHRLDADPANWMDGGSWEGTMTDLLWDEDGEMFKCSPRPAAWRPPHKMTGRRSHDSLLSLKRYRQQISVHYYHHLSDHRCCKRDLVQCEHQQLDNLEFLLAAVLSPALLTCLQRQRGCASMSTSNFMTSIYRHKHRQACRVHRYQQQTLLCTSSCHCIAGVLSLIVTMGTPLVTARACL